MNLSFKASDEQQKTTLEFLCVNILWIFYQMAGGEVKSFVVQPEFYFTRLPRYLISQADLAIGSVQSMAVVINVMCILKVWVGMN